MIICEDQNNFFKLIVNPSYKYREQNFIYSMIIGISIILE